MSAPIKVAIRADAGSVLGTGHYARASAVADAIESAGGCELLLVTGAQGAPLAPAYFTGATRVLALGEGESGPAAALAAMQRTGWAPEVVYLDHYGDVPEWEQLALQSPFGLVVLDDLDAAESAAVIVRPHGGEAVTGDAILLRGPAYLPISKYVRSRSDGPHHRGPSEKLRLNVCFGGTDPTGETAKALEALSVMPDIDADVVIGPGARIEPSVVAEAERLANVGIHRAPSQDALAALMGQADLALGAGGVMLWERLCLGIPSLVICVADNQRPQIKTMVAEGAIRFIGDHDEVTPEVIADAVRALANDPAARTQLADAGGKLIDGRGATRLAAWIRALALTVRDVEAGDAKDLLKWRTDQRNWQHNWDGAGKPDLADHTAWLDAKLADPDCVFRILSLRGSPVGVVRFDLGDGGSSAYLSIYLVPEWHGQKLGLPVYLAAERALRLSHPAVRRVVSRIHADNRGSVRLHLDAGFSLAPSAERPNWLDACKPLD